MTGTTLRSRLRAAAVPPLLGLRRARARAGQSLLVFAGVALGAAMLATAVVGSVAVRDRAVQRELARLGASRTSIQAVWSGVSAQAALPAGALDRGARAALTRITGRPPFSISVYRQASFQGAYVTLGGVDDLGRWIRLRHGRLPKPCSPLRCELVRLGGSGSVPGQAPLHVVGSAALAADAPLANYLGAAGQARPPVLLANGALALARLPLPDADLVARTTGWIVPVTPGSLHDWEIPALSQRVAVASSELQARDRIFSVSAPLDELAAVHARAVVVGSRLLVVGGLGVVLLIAFVGLAATRLRRDTDEAWRRLTWHGAGRAQLVAVSVTEAAVVAAVAVVVGWLAGAAGGALLARRLGADAGAVTRHALLSGRSPGWAVALVVLSALFVVVVLRARVGQRAVFDVAAVGAVGAVALALARGDAGASSVGGGTNALLLLLPALVLFAAAVISVRILRPMLVLLGRNARGASPPLRLAALSLSRGAGSAVLAAAFVVVSIAIVVFALAYRATLEQSQRDQAAFAVPADFVLGEDLEQLVTIQDARAPYARLGHSFDVMRAAGEVPGGPSFTLLAAPSREVAHFDGWSGDFSQNAPGEIAHAIGPTRSTTTRGLVLPLAARALALPVRVRGDDVALALDIRNRRGDFSVVSLGEAGRGTHELRARVPPLARGGRVVAIDVAFPPIAAFLAGHRESGTHLSVQNASVGTLELGRVVAAGKRLPAFRGWIGVGGARGGGGSRFRYVANRARRSLIRPQQPTDGMAVPVLVTPRLARSAGPGGILPLDVAGSPLTARIVGVTRLVPSVDGDAVLGDLGTVTTALNADAPGSAVADEVWIRNASPAARALVERRPFSLLAVESQQAVERALRSDPLARGTLSILVVTAAVALLLALTGIAVTALADRRDERRELFDLRVQGAGQRTLRSYLRIRSALVGAAGVILGIAAGAVLLGLVGGFVAATATGAAPVPPLHVRLDPALLAAWLVAFAAAAAIVVAALTRERA